MEQAQDGSPDGGVSAALERLAPRLAPGATAIDGLKRLTGGASLETWAFDALGADVRRSLILRRRAGPRREGAALPLATEAALLGRAAAAGAPVAELVHACDDADGLGEAYVMARVAGETLGRRIVAGAAFAPARARLGAQCGAALAAIHRAEADDLALPVMDARATLDHYEGIWRKTAAPRATMEAAFRWLRETAPAPVPTVLVHGDFRTGNLMVDPDQGLVAVLDWEIAHLGDPAEDFGWLAVNSWRFGAVAREAGGFASIDEALAGYAAAGGDPPPLARVRWWQAMGSLKWAVITHKMYRAAVEMAALSPERMVIGRRLSECEVDLVALMEAA